MQGSASRSPIFSQVLIYFEKELFHQFRKPSGLRMFLSCILGCTPSKLFGAMSNCNYPWIIDIILVWNEQTRCKMNDSPAGSNSEKTFSMNACIWRINEDGDGYSHSKETPFLSLNVSPPGPRHYICLQIMSHKSLARCGPLQWSWMEFKSLGNAKLTCFLCIVHWKTEVTFSVNVKKRNGI